MSDNYSIDSPDSKVQEKTEDFPLLFLYGFIKRPGSGQINTQLLLLRIQERTRKNELI